MTTSTQLEIPAATSSPPTAASAAGPSKVRAEQLARLAGEHADAHGHLAPPEARQGARRPRARAASRELFGAPDGYEVALGNGGTTAFWDAAALRPRARARAAPRPTASSRASSRRSPRGAPFLGDPIVAAGRARRRAASRVADPGADVVALGAQRDLDRRHGRRSQRPAGDGDALVLDRRDLRRRRPAARRRAGRRLLLRAAEVLRLRRRPVARAAQPGGDRAHRARSPRRDRWIPEFLSLATALDNSRKDQTLNTPALATLLAARRPARLDARATAAWTGASRARRASSDAPLRLGRGVAPTRRRSSPTRPSARSSSARSTSTTTSTPRAVAATLRANGIVDVEPYRKLGRNQLRVAMFPAIEPDDVAGADRLHRLGRRAHGSSA